MLFCVPLLAAVSTASSAASLADEDNLLIVRSADTSAYLAVERSFRAELSQYMPQLVRVHSSSLDAIDELNRFLLSANTKDIDVIVTIGTRAAHEVLKHSPSAAVLSVFIPRQTYHSILNEVAASRQSGNTVGSRSVIYLDQPDERLVLLAKSVLKGGAKISLLKATGQQGEGGLLKTRRCFGDATVKSRKGGRRAERLMQDVNVYRGAISSRSLKRTLKQSDLLIVTPELVKQSPNSIKWMLYMAYQRHIPVVGYSQAFVDAGALVAVYSTPANIGRQAAEMYMSRKNFVDNKLPPSTYPNYFRVSVNNNVADALGYADLSAQKLTQILVESALDCRENHVPVPADGVKQRLTRR